MQCRFACGGRVTLNLPNNEVPPPLSVFAEQWAFVEKADDNNSIYLYHGTNCYRRWEINKSGSVQPGRSGYSFYCTNPRDAHTYARAACMRDLGSGASNSLICEPVVLKVVFTERTWIQADFVTEEVPEANGQINALSVAVLGPVPLVQIVDVLNCHHGRKISGAHIPVRSFADGSLRAGLKRLKEKEYPERVDVWAYKELGQLKQEMETWVSGGRALEVTPADEIRRLTASRL